LLTFAACGGGGTADPDASPHTAGAVAHFEPPAPLAGGNWGKVPYPSDLYLDDTGRVKLTSLPSGPDAAPENEAMLLEGLATMTGAGLRSNVYLPIDLDPGVGIDGTTVAGAATLIDLEASTASALVTIDADVLWREDLGAIVILPTLGTILAPSHTYAAYLTSDAETTDGEAVAASADSRAALDLDTAPADAGVAAAQDSLRPLLELLPSTVTGKLVSATVFRTAGFTGQTQKMRDAVAALPPAIHDVTLVGPDPVDLDVNFGVQTDDAVPGTCRGNTRPQPNNHVKLMIQGRLDLTSFLADTVHVDGFPEYDVDGTPIIRGNLPVDVTLTLPDTADWTNLPVVIYVHGIGRTRLDMLTQANTAARLGLAMIAIDLPYHGSRAARPASEIDTLNELLGTVGPDGVGDTNDIFAAAGLFHLGASGGIPALHPRAIGENLRQAAIELAQVVAFVRDGDLSALEAALVGVAVPQTISFRCDVALLTESLGGMIAGVTLAVEPDLGVAYISSPAAGFPDPSMLHSPNYAGTFATTITGPFDIADRVDVADPTHDMRTDPIVMLYGNVIERGDALVYAPLVTSGALRGGSGPDLVVTMDWGDVWVSNDTTEAYARALGLPFSSMALAAPPAEPVRFVDLPSDPWPVSANLPDGKSGCFVVFSPAGHAMLRRYEEERNFEPEFPPYVPVTPIEIIFPTQVAQSHELWGQLFDSHYTDAGATTILDPYATADAETGGSACP
jgi:hypothetical protein